MRQEMGFDARLETGFDARSKGGGKPLPLKPGDLRAIRGPQKLMNLKLCKMTSERSRRLHLG